MPGNDKLSCEEWLKVRLNFRNAGANLRDDVMGDAKRAGYPKAGLKCARKKIGVRTEHQFDEDGATGNRSWYLED